VSARRLLTLPPERGRSPPAARHSVEVVWSIPEPFHQPSCCGPGLPPRRSGFSHAGGTVRGPAVGFHAPVSQSLRGNRVQDGFLPENTAVTQ